MKIRYRLFLWIGCLFLIVFFASFFIEGYLMRKQMKRAENTLRTEIINRELMRFGRFQEFVNLLQKEGQLNDQLYQIMALSMDLIMTTVDHGQPVIGYDREGKAIPAERLQKLPLEQMLQKKYGIIPFEGKSYFFLKVDFDAQKDLHLFALNLEGKEFLLVDDLAKGSERIIKELATDMRWVALGGFVLLLILLYYLSKKMTRPIVLLAKATEHVAKGHLEKVELPPLPKRSKDEIHILYESFGDMVQGLKEKERVQGVLNKVVSKEVAQEILKGTVRLGGEEKTISVLFADIRHFTEITQRMAPQDALKILNTCMTKISRYVDEHKGVIDKYVGDELMALFGAPVVFNDHAQQAVLCALEMVETLKAWNEERARQGEVRIEMGFGIHTGKVVAGNMGAENRLNYTVIGSNVNLAMRLCSAAAGMQILISKETYESPGVKEMVVAEELPSMQLKGFDKPIPIYEVKKRK